MALHLTVAEVFEMAEQIEHRGLCFYRLAAQRAKDQPARDVYLALARMEGEHEEVFGAIKTGLLSLPPNQRMEPGVAEQIQMIYRQMLSGVEDDLVQRFQGKNSPEEILREAITFEKDTIVFFTELGQANLPAVDRAKIQHIIREELGHLFMLNKHLSAPQAFPSVPAPGPAGVFDATGKPRLGN